MPNEIEPIILPLWIETSRNDSDLNAFIYEYEPQDKSESDLFRKLLQKALEEVVKEQTANIELVTLLKSKVHENGVEHFYDGELRRLNELLKEF